MDVHPAGRAARSSGSTSGSPRTRWCATPTAPRSRPATHFGETAELFDHRLRGQAGDARRRARTRTSPATPRWRGASSPPASWPSCRCSSAATRSRRPPTSSTSCPSTRTSACARCRPRTRSPASASALGAAFAGHLGVTTTSGPGVALKSETIGLAVSLELPLLIIDIQRGGPSTGLPTKTEAADLLHGDVRPPRRGAAADRRGVQPVALLRRGHRGGPHRAQVPHAGDPAVRRLPRQRLRAVAAARRRHAARHLRAVRHRAEPHRRRRHRRVLAVPARPRDARPAVGDPRHARADAPHRRHREGGRPGNISYDAREPRAHGRTCGPPRSPASPTTSRRSRSTATRDAELLRARLGLDVGRHRRRRRAGPAPRGTKVARAHLMHLNPFPPNLGDVAAPLPARCSCPR